MGFLASPIVGKVAGAVGGSLLGGLFKPGLSGAERDAQGSLNRSAATLSGQGQSLYNTGMPAMGQALGYWRTLLGGNRAAMSLATAGPRGAITEQARGAEMGLERSGLRGGVKDLALGDISRQRAGQVAGLTAGIQPAAAGAVGEIGGNMVSGGMGAERSAGGIYSDLLSHASSQRRYADQQSGETGSAIGSLIFDLLNGRNKGGGKGLPGLPGGSSGPF